MPSITIDLPDNLNVPSNWDAQAFFMTKMHEAGILPSDVVSVSVKETGTDSWFTPEQIAQFKENRRRLEEEALKNPLTAKEWEEYYQFVLNFPVADEETIKLQDEAREHMKQWRLPW